MSELISKTKLLEWAKHNLIPSAEKSVKEAIERGLFNPDRAPKPALQEGDKVRHVAKRSGYLGVGIVKEISRSGERAKVDWPDYGAPSYYHINNLIKVEE